MMEDLKRIILEVALVEEPFDIIIGSILHRGLCDDPRDIVEPVLELMEAGYLKGECMRAKGKYSPISDYKKEDLKKELLEEIQRLENLQKGEADKDKWIGSSMYDFQATEEGWKLVEGED